MMLWYYVSDRQERLAAPEDQLAVLAGSGVVRPTTLLWRKGMDQWLSAGELKPEWFSGAVEPAATTALVPSALEDRGLIAELAQTLRIYAGWVTVSGWVHFFTGVAAIACGTVIGYFAAQRPQRLMEWKSRAPEALGLALDHPWWLAAGLGGVALVMLFMGTQLIGSAARVRRAETLQSREELRIALRSLGSFFRTTVLTLLLVLLLTAAGALYHYHPWKKPAEPPAKPVPAAPRERVTI